MTEFERFAAALAKTESDDWEVAVGDAKSKEGSFIVGCNGFSRTGRGSNFMAMGRWQMHPAWYHDWMTEMVRVDASWDEVFRRALQVFWDGEQQAGRPAYKSAMIFHLGRHAVDEGKWDAAYATRFQRFWVELGE